MIGTYYQGQDAIIFANFLVMFGSEPTTITDQKITIKHIEGTSEVIDVNAASMTQIIGNEYYYKWSIASDAFVGDYLIAFSATIDGDYGESIDNIQMLSAAQAVIQGLTNHYTTKAAVVNLLGSNYSESDVKDDFLIFADGYIDALLCTTYRTSITVTQKYDIDRTNIDQIFLKNHPIVSVDYVKDDDETLDTDEYLIYNDEGIIALAEDYYWSQFGSVGYFTKGRQSVEIKYTYGATTIPAILTYLASLIVADITEAAASGISVGSVEKEEIGDYSYELAVGEEGARVKDILRVKKTAISQYGICCENKAI